MLTIHSGTTNSRGNQHADAVSISSFAVLNTDSSTRLPGNADPSSPDVSLASASLITSSEWQICQSLLDYRQLPPHLLPGTEPTSTSRRRIGPDTGKRYNANWALVIFQLIARKTRSCYKLHYWRLLPIISLLEDVSFTRNNSQRRS